MYSRDKVVNLARSWIGKKESNGTHKSIIDIWNSLSNPPRGVKMSYSMPWCACTWSALAIQLSYTKIMPIEVSCEYLIRKAKEMGIWVENDGYVPKPGDAILYDWDDDGNGDDTGWPDHIGVVEYVNVSSGYMRIIEGNYKDSVKERDVLINGRYIRGFITPKYDEVANIYPSIIAPNKNLDAVAQEVIVGLWGNGDERKIRIEAAGYNYDEVQKKVNEKLNGSSTIVTDEKTKPAAKEVLADAYAKKSDKNLTGEYKTTTNLYLRHDAGTNKKAILLMPKGLVVNCYGYYNLDPSSNTKWLYIQVSIDGVKYTGFSHSAYLKRK